MSITHLDTIRSQRGEIPEYKKADYSTDQEVRWCPGCGDYAILSAVQKLLSTLPVHKEDHVFISGIGCSSRFPYYMNTYGFHTIHGRAPAFASGVKASNPNLNVWIVTGDGDSLSIGGNHLIHILRRNFNVNILLFNNRIYGLTKGQYSPTSELGKRSKSTPMGSVDHPFNPVDVALGAGATFVARTYDIDAKHLTETLRQAWEHKGASFVEIYQNCNIFNDKEFEDVVSKQVRADAQVRLAAGQPMRFGADNNKGLIWKKGVVEVASIGEDGVTEDDILIHDPNQDNPGLALTLGRLRNPDSPEVFGVLRSIERPCYEDMLVAQVAEAKAAKKADLHALLHQGYTWTVE
jgi:2-oxoglutarate ferredoxin oxidoreductase subunit beta